MQLIPSKQATQYRQEVELNNETFILTYAWNALNKYWSLSIYNRDLEPIVLGIKIVTQFNLTEQIVKSGMPLGDILCHNISGTFQKIERNDMGLTNELVFYPEGQLE